MNYPKCFFKISSLFILFFLLVTIHNAQAENKRLVEFSLAGINGELLNSEDYMGKVLIVNFWATWCPLCRKETKDLIELTKSYKGHDLQIIGISMDKSGEQAVLRFMEKMQVNYPIAMVTKKIRADFGPIVGIPATFIIDKKGRLIKQKFGYMTRKKLVADIDRLLAE